MMLQYWKDYQLVWQDREGYEAYQQIEVVRMRPDLVWRPDVVLFNKYFILNIQYYVFEWIFNLKYHTLKWKNKC
jgi:hypothetical protein